jgi:hypothetical protein
LCKRLRAENFRTNRCAYLLSNWRQVSEAGSVEPEWQV